MSAAIVPATPASVHELELDDLLAVVAKLCEVRPGRELLDGARAAELVVDAGEAADEDERVGRGRKRVRAQHGLIHPPERQAGK